MAGKKTLINGHIFDSNFEAQTYLLLLENGVNITKLQPEFELFPEFEYEDFEGKSHKYRKIVYTPDFLINDNIALEVKGFQTGEYMLRKKLFIMKYNKQYKHIQINNIKETKEFIKKINGGNK